MQNDERDHDHDRGLAHDLKTMADRRSILKWIAGAGVVAVVGCGDDSETSTSSTTSTSGTTSGSATSTSSSTTGGGSCPTIPEETAGPYPGDGSNGPNVLTVSGIVRSDITTSLGGAGGTAAGVPLTVTLTLVDSNAACAPLAGYAVYLWHCNIDGSYSMYSADVADENYLRGVQETSSDGTVTFTTIFPGAYMGRWPHIHFEVYPSLAMATDPANKVATSQLALPKEACDAAYAAAGYEASVTNLAQTSLESDNVFSDGSSSQVATTTGTVADGFDATLMVSISG